MTKKKRRRKLSVYAIYQGDKFIDVGTVRDMSKRQGWTENHIRRMTTAIYKEKSNGSPNAYTLIKLEGEYDYAKY